MFKHYAICGLALLAIAAVLSVSADAAPRTAAPTYDRSCIGAAGWGPAPDSERPCVRVARLFEDGSGLLVQEDAAGTYRVECVLQNPREVRQAGSYETECRRTR
jgi:hypothetical protein